MPNTTKEISATEAVKIEKELNEMKNILEKYSNWFYRKNQLETIKMMKIEMENKK